MAGLLSESERLPVVELLLNVDADDDDDCTDFDDDDELVGVALRSVDASGLEIGRDRREFEAAVISLDFPRPLATSAYDNPERTKPPVFARTLLRTSALGFFAQVFACLLIP